MERLRVVVPGSLQDYRAQQPVGWVDRTKEREAPLLPRRLERRAWDAPGGGKNARVGYEAARLLDVSPARVRRMLRSGELEGERGERSAAGAGDAEATVVMPPKAPSTAVDDAPSETSERLSEGVQDLREKSEALISGLEQLALKEELRREEERSQRLRAELVQERTRGEPPEERGPDWKRWLGDG